MLAPLDLERIQSVLSTPEGWIELGVILACFAAGWLADRRVRLVTRGDSRVVKFGTGGANRLIFPLTTLALLLLARAALGREYSPAFFPIAIPLVVALALIRLCVYALRNVFGASDKLPLSERVVSFLIWGTLLLHYLGVLPELRALLEEAQLPIGKTSVSLLDIARDAVILVLTLIISLWVSGLVEHWLMRMPDVDRNVRVVMAKFFRAVLLIIGVLIALPLLGIDLTVLSVFGGALGVGIGLGLQKLASNYIAGFTILLDRSIRLGDMITVDNRFGVVTKVTSRYVVVRSLDGIEAIVPNETLVVTTVLNHSYSNQGTRIAIPVQISYDSNVELAMRLMREIAMGEPRVLRAPVGPEVFILRFAESGIELELTVWINDPENGQATLKSVMNLGIWKAFAEHCIEIPYPRREVRLLTTAGDTTPPAEPKIDGDLSL
jgi:small-conductance mechanosensitive channel